jgi:hypothetical protein
MSARLRFRSRVFLRTQLGDAEIDDLDDFLAVRGAL